MPATGVGGSGSWVAAVQVGVMLTAKPTVPYGGLLSAGGLVKPAMAAARGAGMRDITVLSHQPAPETGAGLAIARGGDGALLAQRGRAVDSGTMIKGGAKGAADGLITLCACCHSEECDCQHGYQRFEFHSVKGIVPQSNRISAQSKYQVLLRG
jgi:hypothetical protein